MSCRLFFICLYILITTICTGQEHPDNTPRYAGNVQYYGDLITADTSYTNDTIEIVHFYKRRKKDIEGRKTIKIYHDHHLVRARSYFLSTWSESFYFYDSLGRLKQIENYSETGELTSRIIRTYSGDTLRITSSNWLNTNMAEVVFDSNGHMSQHRIFIDGACLDWKRYSIVRTSDLDQYYTMQCDCNGHIIDTIVYKSDNKLLRTVISVSYDDSGKIEATSICRYDSQNREVECSGLIISGNVYGEPGETSTTYYTYSEPTEEYFSRKSIVSRSGNSENIYYSWTICRKCKWPSGPK